ncbi:KipI family sensor histidine kinase inhibitor [Serinibacter salmoneus]|uniref:KipI family sensor histidine kinase inhibitor n=1 Tax=Serinibacter salmoneus TaxID=556530 RepID=A0A2A9D1V3_9MICO|nr:KipI family sensor histidine kinase inhibitor [Serinibacter salmoneus]
MRPFGERALLLDVADSAAARSLAPLVAAAPGVLDVVPGAASLLVRCGDAAAARDLARAWAAEPPRVQDGAAATGREVRIGVRYDGADLAEVGRRTGLGEAGVIAAHTGATYVAAFAGFAPGFVYLEGLPGVLQLPRRHDPRTRVPAGSVAIAAGYTSVYPRSSPGGWHLLGTTTAVLFDPGRDPAALIRPGDTVRFEPLPDPIPDPMPEPRRGEEPA